MNELVAGRFRVTGVLGEGAMGVVYRAFDEVLARDLALKEMRVPAGVDAGEALERFVTEARAAARLSDPAIVTVHDVVQDGDRVLIAMELLNGATLAAALGLAPDGIAADQVRDVMSAVAGALAAAHRDGVIHRDLKPDNIFWLESGRVVVTDFGLARIGAGRGTQIGTVMGTPGYMAPEQIRGDVVGPPADVFSWGAIAHELLTGVPAFGGPELEPTALMWRVVNEPAPALHLPDDPALAALIEWALRKDPDSRPPDGAALLDALHGGALATPPTPAYAPDAPAAPHQPPAARSRKLAAGLAAATAAVVTVITILVLTLTNTTPQAPPMTQIATRQRTTTPDTTQATATSRTLTVVSSTASTTRNPVPLRCTGQVIDYAGPNLHDGDLQTGWGTTPGDGVGSSITLDLGREVTLTSIGLTPGYAKTGPRQDTNCVDVPAFERNRFVESVRYEFDDGSSVLQAFQRSPELQRIDVDVRTRFVRMTILDTDRPPGADNDTIMSEIELRGH